MQNEADGMPGTQRSMSLLRNIDAGPLDGILLSMELFAADKRPGKVNLGVGMYYDEAGRIPVMKPVLTANDHLNTLAASRSYLPAEGMPAFRTAIEQLLFGADCKALADGRIATAQALGGTGALKLAAEMISEVAPTKRIAVSDPTWPNHIPLFEGAGLVPEPYPYYDRATGEFDFAGMCGALAVLPHGTPVLLHACCHNPSGVDPSEEQWRAIVAILVERDLIPLVDIAYLGFGRGLADDAYLVRLLAESGLPTFVASSCSKNFSIYGERLGALSVIAGSKADAGLVMARLKTLARSIYSTPPLHGASLVSHILGDPTLRAEWQAELESMRLRIVEMRVALADRLAANSGVPDFSFITRQHGLFSYSRLTAVQVQRLTDEFAIYAVKDGRLCMAALNYGNVDRVANAIRQVLLSEDKVAAE